MVRHPRLVAPLPVCALAFPAALALAALVLPACSSNGNASGGGGHGTAASAAGGHSPHTTGSNTGGGGPAVDVGASVLMMHNHASRDGLYDDAAFTKAAAAKLHKTSFSASVMGDEYAQVLFYDAKGSGKDLIIASTEQNQVSAFDPATGKAVWQKTVGPESPQGIFGCGNIDPNGITGTPAIDYATRTLYLSAAIQEGGSPHHRVFALSLDDGHTLSGWPVDMDTKATFTGGITFDSTTHGERGGLLVVGDTLYVPYGGLWGDCGTYHGWLAAIPTQDPQHPHFWSTTANGGGAWGVGGPASDGSRVLFVTGNTFGASSWGGGEAVISFTSPTLASKTYFTPSNWMDLDDGDTDLGGSGVVLVDPPGSSKKLAVALGKDGNIYILDRENLGGEGGQLFVTQVADGTIIQAATSYSTSNGTYVVFRGQPSSCPGGGGGDLVAVRITASSADVAWCATQNGTGSPIATKSGDQVIVWGVGAEGDSRLHGFDGDTGATLFDGGGANDAMGSLNHLITPVVAKGKIYVGGSGAVYAFTL
jgi:hypothetical protein